MPVSREDNRRMAIGTRLIACPSCSCHAFARETVCPNCGAPLRAPNGALPRTAGAMMLGLTIATTTAAGACVQSAYGGPPTGGGAYGGEGGMTGSTAISAYGIASTGNTVGVGGNAGAGGTAGGGGTGGTSGTGGAGGTGGGK